MTGCAGFESFYCISRNGFPKFWKYFQKKAEISESWEIFPYSCFSLMGQIFLFINKTINGDHAKRQENARR